MAITVMERSNSRPLNVDPKSSSATREYWAMSDDIQVDVLEINDAFAVNSPDTYLGLIKKSIKSSPQGAGFWYGTVEYGTIEGKEMEGQDGSGNSPEPPEAKESDRLGNDVSFTTAGGTQHITKSLETIEHRAAGDLPAPRHDGAIGVSKSGVAGCDIIVPKFEISITRRISYIDWKYLHGLVFCTGRTNSRRWNTFEEGEVLFLGAEGKYDGSNRDECWLVTFKLDVVKNGTQEIVIVPNTAIATPENPNPRPNWLRVGAKKGHDYLWVGFAEDVDADSATMVRKPKYAYIERVYEKADFKKYLGF